MLYATIMAGGAGTRFWPASRKSQPKQLLNLAGNRTMIQSTVDRLDGLCPPENFLIVTNQALVEPIADQLPDLPRSSIIGEPAKRDTAPCIGLAAAWVANKEPDATMVVMPADHVIQPNEIFQEAIQHAADLVQLDPSRIVTFGIQPSYPAEVFGYIERGEQVDSSTAHATFDVKRFREKPDLKTAEGFLEAGTFYWNSGIFVWRAQTILDALKMYQPEMHEHISRIAETFDTDQFAETLQTEFSAIKGTSIDYAVMEKYNNVLVVEAPFEWDDLGSWTAVPRQNGTDEAGNTIQGRHLGIETTGSIVRTDDNHLLVTIGVQDCIVVHTDNATLVVDRKHEAKIKDIVGQLGELKWDQYL